ncbi:GIY-YIG nuclease family protein, partial [Nocardioides sp.]|uniref:GIY-YIG nuclease family protein n=1 Tax=Nocardioides sp. TaxID=35761 RepID=UPI0034DF4D73
MCYLYILENEHSDRHYIGISKNIDNRVDSHNKGSVKSTKAYRPWKLAYSEKFLDKTS